MAPEGSRSRTVSASRPCCRPRESSERSGCRNVPGSAWLHQGGETAAETRAQAKLWVLPPETLEGQVERGERKLGRSRKRTSAIPSFHQGAGGN